MNLGVDLPKAAVIDTAFGFVRSAAEVMRTGGLRAAARPAAA